MCNNTVFKRFEHDVSAAVTHFEYSHKNDERATWLFLRRERITALGDIFLGPRIPPEDSLILSPEQIAYLSGFDESIHYREL